MKKYYIESRRKGISSVGPTVKRRKDTSIGNILRKNRLPKHVTEETHQRQEDEEEDVTSYWMILRKRGDTGN